jgi:hypothetical protein
LALRGIPLGAAIVDRCFLLPTAGKTQIFDYLLPAHLYFGPERSDERKNSFLTSWPQACVSP